MIVWICTWGKSGRSSLLNWQHLTKSCLKALGVSFRASVGSGLRNPRPTMNRIWMVIEIHTVVNHYVNKDRTSRKCTCIIYSTRLWFGKQNIEPNKQAYKQASKQTNKQTNKCDCCDVMPSSTNQVSLLEVGIRKLS